MRCQNYWSRFTIAVDHNFRSAGVRLAHNAWELAGIQYTLVTGKTVMNSRIRTPFYKFFLNPDYVAARSLRLLRSRLLKSQALHPARARAPLHLPHRFFDVKSFYKILPLLPIVIAKSRLNVSGISSRHVVFVRRLGDLVSGGKAANRGRCLWSFVVKVRRMIIAVNIPT